MTAGTETRSAKAELDAARRVAVKVGSAILCGTDGVVRSGWLASFAGDVAALRAGGREMAVVSSGAIALGRKRLGLGAFLRLDEKQAASAAGQAMLADAWQAAFEPHGIQIAQILLTLEDTENRRRYLNARATMRTLLDLGALPIINENDTIATSEIRYGDNDRLAAHAAQIIDCDVLVILSDVDGLYTADPRIDPSATRVEVVTSITPEIERVAAGPNAASGVGAGGMASKVAAAKIAAGNGCATIIAPGHIDHPIAEILKGGPGTLFAPATSRESARRQWIAGRLKPSGRIGLDAGAANAVASGASLLPAGVVSVEGDFSRGDAVTLAGPDGAPIGQGLAAYNADEIRRIAGCKSEEMEALLGYRRRPAVVEKNDLVLRLPHDSRR